MQTTGSVCVRQKCQSLKVHAQAAGSGVQAEAEFDGKHIGDLLSPPLPVPITINPLTHDNH